MNRVLIIPAVVLALASCESGGPIRSTGYDPLDAAGGTGTTVPLAQGGIMPGDFVVTSMNNAVFFKSRPQGDAAADRLLDANTRMKVVSNDGSYLKVELDSGEVGWIPPVMVIEEGSVQTPLGPNEVQVYPLIQGQDEPVDPTIPTIPPMIDPDAPAPELPVEAPLPDDAPTPGLGVEPELPDAAAGGTPEETPDEPQVEIEED